MLTLETVTKSRYIDRSVIGFRKNERIKYTLNRDGFMKKNLTEKQHNFVNNYISNGFNATSAALDAGYSPKYAESQAYKLVNHPAINERLSDAYKEAEKTIGVPFDERANILKQIIKSCENSPIAQDKRVMITAIAELNKMTGGYAPNRKVSVTIDATKERLNEAKRVYEEY